MGHYQMVRLSDLTAIGEAGALPPEVLGLADADLADLSWADPALELAGFGYWPLKVTLPEFDARTHQLGPLGPVTLDGEEKVALAEYSVVPRLVVEPVRIKKFWLFQRFSEDEERRYAALEYQARNMTPADLADPAKEPLFQIQRFDRRLGAIEFVELDAAMTLGVFELLRLLGVFGAPEDQASHDRVAQILAAPQPYEVA